MSVFGGAVISRDMSGYFHFQKCSLCFHFHKYVWFYHLKKCVWFFSFSEIGLVLLMSCLLASVNTNKTTLPDGSLHECTSSNRQTIVNYSSCLIVPNISNGFRFQSDNITKTNLLVQQLCMCTLQFGFFCFKIKMIFLFQQLTFSKARFCTIRLYFTEFIRNPLYK